MTLQEALEAMLPHRGEQVVVTTMGSAGVWPTLSDSPLDFAYLPSSMGQGIALALGLALARPSRGVIVVMGDGSLLMNLGSLVTVAQFPVNLRVVLIDNGLYEVTGGQEVAGSGRVDFAGLAQSAGISRVASFNELDVWSRGAREYLSGDGPSFVHLKVDGQLGQKTPSPPRPMSEQIARLRAAIC